MHYRDRHNDRVQHNQSAPRNGPESESAHLVQHVYAEGYHLRPRLGVAQGHRD